MCKHWIELDDERGNLFEYCRGRKKKCACAGVLKQCNYKDYFEKESDKNKIPWSFFRKQLVKNL
jgi:ribosomal protein S21